MSWKNEIKKEESEKELKSKLKGKGIDADAIDEAIYRVKQKVTDKKIDEFSRKEVESVIKEIYDRRLRNLFG